MFVVRHRIQQAKYVNPFGLVKTVKQRCIRGAFFAQKFQLRIIHDDVAAVADAEFLAHLQYDLRSVRFRFHFSLPHQRSSLGAPFHPALHRLSSPIG